MHANFILIVNLMYFYNKGGRGNKLCVYDKSWLSCHLGIFEKWSSNDKEYWCKLVNSWLIVRYIAWLKVEMKNLKKTLGSKKYLEVVNHVYRV